MSAGLVVAVRSLFAFTVLLLFTRMLGKQHVGQLTLFDFAAAITIGSIAATMSVELENPTTNGLIGLSIWTLATLSLQFASAKWRPVHRMVTGEPLILVQNGKIMESAMAKARYAIDELKMQLRQMGVFEMADVEFAVLETNGALSVLRKAQEQPITPRDLQISTEYKGLPTELVVAGEIIQENLERIGLNQAWLKQALAAQGVKSVEQVDYAEINTRGELYVNARDDQPLLVHEGADRPGSQG